MFQGRTVKFQFFVTLVNPQQLPTFEAFLWQSVALKISTDLHETVLFGPRKYIIKTMSTQDINSFSYIIKRSGKTDRVTGGWSQLDGLCVHIVWNMYITSNLDRQILLMEFVMICVEYGICKYSTLPKFNMQPEHHESEKETYLNHTSMTLGSKC